ncbi:MAG TPA: polysaccharide biosynthesis C-terminal domain-containing protein [Candidatus Hydrogenedentes bacterium]|nr:polysaccharide biosynthesis C-terminal domain-containing protein [Candidatus Hydrogenedentota bacterium]
MNTDLQREKTFISGRLRHSAQSSLWNGSAAKAVLTVIDQGVVSAANFLSLIIVGRACAQSELGLYALGFTIVLFAMNSQNALITSAYIVFSPRLSGEAHARYTGSTLVHHVTLAVIIAAGLAVAGGLFAFMTAPTADLAGLDRVLWALAMVIFFILLKEYARQVCFAGLRTGAALVLDLGMSALQVGGLTALGVMGHLSAGRAYGVIGVAAAFAALTWLGTQRRRFAPVRSEVLPDFLRNWAYCRWIFAMNLAYVAANQAYPWVLVGFHGPVANGVFGACAGVVFFANPFVLGLSNFLGPKAVHAYKEGGVPGMRSVVRKATLFFAVTMTLFWLGMTLLGEWLLVLLFGPAYAGNGVTVSILAASQLIWSLTIPVNFGLNAMERPDVAFKSLLLALAFTFTAGVWLVNAFGPAGVACGLLAGNGIACVYNRVVFARESRRRELMDPTDTGEGKDAL